MAGCTLCAALTRGAARAGRVTLQLVPRRKKAKKKVGSPIFHSLPLLYFPVFKKCADRMLPAVLAEGMSSSPSLRASFGV